MARPLKYSPHSETERTAHQELEELLQTLHESGILRVLNGFIGKFPEISEVAVQQLNGQTGRNILSNLTILLGALAELNPVDLRESVEGLVEGVRGWNHSLRRRAPGAVHLLAMLSRPDTRRGVQAVLSLMQGLGQHLRPDTHASTQIVPAEMH